MKKFSSNPKFTLILFTLFFSSIFAQDLFSQTYYSKGSLNAELTTSWTSNRNGTGSSPSSFSAPGIVLVVQNQHTMTVSTTTMTLNGNNSKLQIESGGEFITNFAINIAPSCTFQIDSAGKYIHNVTTIQVFNGIENFHKKSSVEIRNFPLNSIPNISWGNLRIYAPTSISNNLTFNGNLQTVKGNLEILATGSPTVKEVRFAATQEYTLTIGGDFTISGGIVDLMFTDSDSPKSHLIIGGSFIWDGGILRRTNVNGDTRFYLSGKNKVLSRSGGTLEANYINYYLPDTASYKLDTDFYMNYYLYVNGTLDFGTKKLLNALFILQPLGRLKIGSPQGLSGNVQTSDNLFLEGSTIEYNGTSAQVTSALLANAVSSNIIISNINGPVTLSDSATFKRGVTINRGSTLDIGDFNMKGSGVNSALKGEGTIKLNGNIATQVTGFNTNTFKNTGTFEFAGTSQIVPAGTYSKLKVNGLGVTLNGNVIVNDTLYMQSGNVTLGANNITAKTVRGGSASSYIVTDGTGALKINSVSGPVLFPVGRTSYNPLIIDNTFGAADNFTVSVQDIIDNPTFNDAHAVQRQWNIAEDVAGGSNADITFQWNTSDEGSMFNRNSGTLFAGHWNGIMYDIYPAPLGGANDVWTVTVAGKTSFSPFIVGDDSALPVELASFTSNVNGSNVKLSWSTVSEINNSGFEIESKLEGESTWKKAGFVAGAGNSNVLNQYTFLHKGLAAGKYNYRLKQIDLNGNFEYHNLANEVIIGIPSKFTLSQNYPNPFNPSTKINYELPVTNYVSLKVYDIQGKEVMTLVDQVKEAGYYTVNFDAKNLSSGMYFYSLKAGEFSSVKKMVLVK